MKLSMLRESDIRPNQAWAGTGSRYERTYQKRQAGGAGGPGIGKIDMTQSLSDILAEPESQPDQMAEIQRLRDQIIELWPEGDVSDPATIERLKSLLQNAMTSLETIPTR